MAHSQQVDNAATPWYHCAPRMTLGEGPLYRESDSTLHWVDCYSEPPKLHTLHVDPITGEALGRDSIHPLKDSVSVMRFRRGKPGSYICAYWQGIAFMDEVTGKLEIIKEIIPPSDREIRRFNDGGVDAKGRFWVAENDLKAMTYEPGKLPESHGKPLGRLWRYDPDGSLHQMADGFICGNGVCWSPDDKTMYLNDSTAMTTYAFDFDLEAGEISNQRPLIDWSKAGGVPDGMVIDTDGNLWVAVFGANRVMVYNPDGDCLKDTYLTAKRLTCPTWGGRNNDILYITSAQEATEKDDDGGHMFMLKETGANGVPKPEFAG